MKPNIQIWSIDRLKPYDRNVKRHDKPQVAKIAASIKEFGWTQPIVVDKDGTIIAGHGRRLAALSLEMTEVPVWVRDDLGPAEVRALRLADNRVAESSIDTELFKKELADLDFDLTGIFDAKELEFVAADLGEINVGAFVDDISAAVDKQTEQVRQAAETSAAKPVAVHKVLGFKEIPGDQQLKVSRFMAHIEHETGVRGEHAFLLWVDRVLEGVSQ